MSERQHETLVTLAKTCVGKPFLYGASPALAPDKFDCSSLTQYLYKQIGFDLPRSSIEQAHLGRVVEYADLKVGDLLFFRGSVGHYNVEFPLGVGHVALYLGKSTVIQAVGTKGKVVQTPLQEIQQRDDLVVIKRVLAE